MSGLGGRDDAELTPEVAKRRYRLAWYAYVFVADEAQRHELGELMDSLQSIIAYGPRDTRWQEFADSLPGFREFWSPTSLLRQLKKDDK